MICKDIYLSLSKKHRKDCALPENAPPIHHLVIMSTIKYNIPCTLFMWDKKVRLDVVE
jgi:hypothetical protein